MTLVMVFSIRVVIESAKNTLPRPSFEELAVKEAKGNQGRAEIQSVRPWKSDSSSGNKEVDLVKNSPLCYLGHS